MISAPCTSHLLSDGQAAAAATRPLASHLTGRPPAPPRHLHGAGRARARHTQRRAARIQSHRVADNPPPCLHHPAHACSDKTLRERQSAVARIEQLGGGCAPARVRARRARVADLSLRARQQFPFTRPSASAAPPNCWVRGRPRCQSGSGIGAWLRRHGA